MTDTQTPVAQAEAGELPIGQVLAILWRGRWIIAVTTILSLALGFFYVARRGTIYRATSKLYVERSGPSILAASDFLMGGGSKNYANTQAELLRSTKILRSALAKPELRSSEILRPVKNRVIWLKRALKISVGKQDEIISISLDSKFVEDACLIVNAVVDAYMVNHSANKKSTAKDLLERFTESRETESKKLKQIRDEMADFIRKNSSHTFNQSGVTDFEGNRLRELSTELAKAEIEARDAEFALQEAAKLAEQPESLREILQMQGGRGAQGDDGRLAAELKRQAWELRKRRPTLLAEVTAQHPAILALDSQLDEIDAQLREIRKRAELFAKQYVGHLADRVSSAKKKVQSTQRRVEAQQRVVAELGGKNWEFRDFEQRRERAQERYDELSKSIAQINLADIQDDEKNLLNIHLFDSASMETATVASSRAMVIAIFLVLGLMSGFGLAWLRGVFDQRIRTVDDVAIGVQLALLGTMPRVQIDGEEKDAIVTWDEHSDLAEAARSLRTAVYFGMPKDEGRLIHVTSPDSGDGKSMIISKLGIAMAQAGQRTLIIDADLRRPTQAKLFHLDQEHGLATALAQGTAEDLTIQKTRLDSLDVMTSGPIPANPAEILNSRAFEELLGRLSEKDHRILVDSRHVLPVLSRASRPKIPPAKPASGST